MNHSRFLAALIAISILLPAGALSAAPSSGAAAALAASTLDLGTMLRYALEDERIARAEYLTVLARFPGARPFANTVKAEETHIGWLVDLYRTHGLVVPADTTAEMTPPATLDAALEVGRVAEIDNIAMYDRFLTKALPEDVRRVFLQLKSASENHLRAFTTGGGRRS